MPLLLYLYFIKYDNCEIVTLVQSALDLSVCMLVDLWTFVNLPQCLCAVAIKGHPFNIHPPLDLADDMSYF